MDVLCQSPLSTVCLTIAPDVIEYEKQSTNVFVTNNQFFVKSLIDHEIAYKF
jgi:hypothetical protein